MDAYGACFTNWEILMTRSDRGRNELSNAVLTTALRLNTNELHLFLYFDFRKMRARGACFTDWEFLMTRQDRGRRGRSNAVETIALRRKTSEFRAFLFLSFGLL